MMKKLLLSFVSFLLALQVSAQFGGAPVTMDAAIKTNGEECSVTFEAQLLPTM